jgi:hypothetical protein
MGFRDIISKLGEKRRERSEKFKEIEEDYRLQKMLEERQKSSNERELERFQKEEREENIKEALEFYRKQKDNDIRFGHNPLDTPNVTNHTDWEVLKEKNQFAAKGNMFVGQGNIHRSNPNLLKNNRKLFGI